MKKQQIKSLQLKKKSIAAITTNEIRGGWTWTTTIQDISKSCPHNCGSKQ